MMLVQFSLFFGAQVQSALGLPTISQMQGCIIAYSTCYTVAAGLHMPVSDNTNRTACAGVYASSPSAQRQT